MGTPPIASPPLVLYIKLWTCVFNLFVVLLFQGAIYGMAQAIPDRSLVTEISRGFLDCLYSTEVGNSNGSHMNGKDHWVRRGPAPPSLQSSKLIT